MDEVRFNLEQKGPVRYFTPDRTAIVASVSEAHSRLAKLIGKRLDKETIVFWAIFEHPKDRDGFMLRETVVIDTSAYISPYMVHVANLDEARGMIPRGMTRLTRQPTDPILLVETWI